MPFFSVIVPLYNKETFVKNAIESILAQDFQDFEILVVDDGCTDQSRAVVSTIESASLRILTHEQNKGLSAARNTGIREAQGSQLAFLDADDVWQPNYLSTIHELIQRFPETHLWATNYEEVYADEVFIVHKNPAFQQDELTVVGDFFACNVGKPIYFPSSFCAAKEVFDTVGYYDESITYAEDVDLNIRANTRFKLAYANKPLVRYTLFSENQITNSHFSSKVIPNFAQYDALLEGHATLKKYIDFNRYIFAKYYKQEEAWEKFDLIRKEISSSSLNKKQLFLLDAPLFLLRWVKQIKVFLIRHGILLTTYDR
jgi:glycosyltransferase involved in cell wall biosynthesis